MYIYGGKPLPLDEKISEKLLDIVNVHHTFNEMAVSKYIYPYYDYILLNVHEAYIHPRKGRAAFNIKKYNSSFIFIVNEAQEKSRSFCKILKYLCGENPDIKTKNYIDQLFRNNGEDIEFTREEVKGENLVGKYRAEKLKVDGNELGYFLIAGQKGNSIEWIGLINEIDVDKAEGKLGIGAR